MIKYQIMNCRRTASVYLQIGQNLSAPARQQLQSGIGSSKFGFRAVQVELKVQLKVNGDQSIFFGVREAENM